NFYGSLHGGAVAAIAELVMEACVKSVVKKDLFLGEFATSYLSAVQVNAELEVGGLILRQGRNVTVTSVEFRIKETKKLVYTARATFYNVPVANL
ncbi:Thioesterase superfamily protein, partial [Thalictrum thalictroides]